MRKEQERKYPSSVGGLLMLCQPSISRAEFFHTWKELEKKERCHPKCKKVAPCKKKRSVFYAKESAYKGSEVLSSVKDIITFIPYPTRQLIMILLCKKYWSFERQKQGLLFLKKSLFENESKFTCLPKFFMICLVGLFLRSKDGRKIKKKNSPGHNSAWKWQPIEKRKNANKQTLPQKK